MRIEYPPATTLSKITIDQDLDMGAYFVTTGLKLSKVTIDADKDMAGKALTNLGHVALAANKLFKTPNLCIKELGASTLGILDDTGTTRKSLELGNINPFGYLLFSQTGQYIGAANANGFYVMLEARDDDDATHEVGRLTGAATAHMNFVKERLKVDGLVISPSKHVLKASDETVNNSATLQDDDELLLAVAIGESWEFHAKLHVTTVIGGSDFKLAFTVPANAEVQYVFVGLDASGAASQQSIVASGGEITVDTALGYAVIVVHGLVQIGDTAGNLQLQWAQNGAGAGDTIVKAGSTLVAHRLD